MKTFSASRTVAVPVSRLFEAFANHKLSPEISPDVESIEILPGPSDGVGARFVEVRRQGKKLIPMEFEVTEFTQDETLRVVNHHGGVEWDSVMRFSNAGNGARVDVDMHAKMKSFMPRLMIPLFGKVIQKGFEKQLDATVKWLESGAGQSSE